MVAYHDTEWGVPVHDDPTHFEFLVLEGAQAGLSWSTILKRRAGYRKAFAGFDAAKVARFTPARVEKLLGRPRHHPQPGQGRSPPCATPAPSWRCRRSSAPSTPTSGASSVAGRSSTSGGAWRQLPAVTAESEAFSADLRRRGFGFVGPTVCYAHLQATGLVNDHLVGCFRYAELTGVGASGRGRRSGT